MLKPSAVILILLAAILALLAPPATGYAQSTSAEAREDQLYKNGTASMNSEQWQNAIDQFSKIKGSKADGAMYWKAYAQNKLGQREAALETTGSLMKQHPRSTCVNHARALEIEIRGESGPATASAPDRHS